MRNKLFLILIFALLVIGFIFSTGEGSTIEIGSESFEDVGYIVGEDLDITAKSVTVTKEDSRSRIDFLEGGSVNIEGILFEDIDSSKGSYIKLNEDGEIFQADLTASDETIFTLEGKDYLVPKGANLYYYDGVIDIIGDSFEIKDESSDSFTKIDILGQDIFSVSKDNEGESVLKGNFVVGDDVVNGVAIVSEGRISELWSGSAEVGGIVHENSKDLSFGSLGDSNVRNSWLDRKESRKLRFYYDDNFNPLEHEGEAYFNYGDEQISLGGYGFTSDLGKKNSVFGDMDTEKEVKLVGTKERNMRITMKGGNIRMAKSSNSNLDFDISHKGDFILDNGRNVIYSQKSLDLGRQEMFVKAKYDDEFTYSYDLNLNEGEHILKNNFFKDKEGRELFNGNLPWESAVLKIREISDLEARQIETGLEEEGKLIYIGKPPFLDWFKGEYGEALMRNIYLGQETANQNRDGVMGDPLYYFGLMQAEGAGYYEIDEYGRKNHKGLFDLYIENPEREVLGTVGLTLVGSENNIRRLKEGRYIPEDLEVDSTSLGGKLYMPAQSTEDVFVYAAGVINNQERKLTDSIVSMYGEDVLNKMSEDEFNYWKTLSYWAPFTYEQILADRENNYVENWGDKEKPVYDPKGKTLGNIEYAKWLARHRTDYQYYLKELGIFSYP